MLLFHNFCDNNYNNTRSYYIGTISRKAAPVLCTCCADWLEYARSLKAVH